MKSAKKRIVHTLTAAATCAAMVSPAAAFDLTGGYYMTYGDANSYSLPINGLEVMAGPGQIDLYTKLGLQSQLGNPIAGIWTAIWVVLTVIGAVMAGKGAEWTNPIRRVVPLEVLNERGR